MTRRYRARLDDYLRWRGTERVLFRPTFTEGDGPSAEAAMQAWESRGVALPAVVAGADRLADYVQGKRSRDWHITEWRQGIRSGWILPEELVGTFGLTAEEIATVVR